MDAWWWVDGWWWWMDGWMHFVAYIIHVCVCICSMYMVHVPYAHMPHLKDLKILLVSWDSFPKRVGKEHIASSLSKIWCCRSTFCRSWCAMDVDHLGISIRHVLTTYEIHSYLAAYQMGLALFLATYLDSWNLGFFQPLGPFDFQGGVLALLQLLLAHGLKKVGLGLVPWIFSSFPLWQVHWGCQWTHSSPTKSRPFF